MKNIEKLLPVWLFSQTGLPKMLRWSKYLEYSNGKPASHNGIRRQNVAQHTLSKFTVYTMIIPELQRIFGTGIDFELLSSGIIYHDFAEPLRKQKYDILATDKKNSDDVAEYELFIKFLKESGLSVDEEMYKNMEKAFLLQFVLTSYYEFPDTAKRVMEKIRKSNTEKNAAILFQILEKWEYYFYAHEHRHKHPTIWDDVHLRNGVLVEQWIQKYPKKYHKPLYELFVN